MPLVNTERHKKYSDYLQQMLNAFCVVWVNWLQRARLRLLTTQYVIVTDRVK